jgi:hypothetical protein
MTDGEERLAGLLHMHKGKAVSGAGCIKRKQ